MARTGRLVTLASTPLHREGQVQVDVTGAVRELNGRLTGYIHKGNRTFSPPTHRGSRVAKYHKQVPCWFGSLTSATGRDYEADSRQDVIRKLIEARERESGRAVSL